MRIREICALHLSFVEHCDISDEKEYDSVTQWQWPPNRATNQVMAKARWPEKLELEVLGFESRIEQKFLREIRVPKLIVRNEIN